jgi:DNA processing protein
MDKITKLTPKGSFYPKLLKEIPDRPKIIYCRGNLKLFKDRFFIAVVGSRRPTRYGLVQTQRIVRELAQAGVVVVSGLALGIDGAAHAGALCAKGKTIAVLGSAINNIYPVSNEPLARNILAEGGLIISEYAPGSETFKSNFPMRNRIIAGLSQGVVVTEAAEKSGALITAYLGIDYNREVFALPGDVGRTNSFGPNSLIQKGATCLSSAEEILNILGIADKNELILPLNNVEKEIIRMVGEGRSFDQMVQGAKIDSGTLNAVLARLELKGLIKSALGGYYLNSKI